MAWSPSSITVGGETFTEADFVPFSFAATWPRFLNALAVHLVSVGALSGVQAATNIATSDGGTTWTFDSAAEPENGGLLLLRFPSENAASGSGHPISRNGGLSYTLRNSDGNPITTGGLIRPNRYYMGRRDGTTIALDDLDLVQWVFNRMRLVGPSASIDLQDSTSQTVGLVRILQVNGKLLIYVNGGGSAIGTLGLQLGSDGLFADAVGFRNADGAEVFHPSNPPLWWKDIQAHLELLTDGYWEDQLALVQITGGEPYTLSATDKGADVISAGQVVITRGMAINQDVPLRIRVGASATIIAPQIWAGTEDGLAKGNAQLGDVTSNSVTSTFTFTAGNPVTEGWRIGDVIRPASLAWAPNNGVDFTIISFGGTSNRTVTVSPRPETDSSPDGSYTFTRQGSRQLALPANSYFIIRREQTCFVADQRSIFSTVATAALPIPTYILPTDGQSWAVRMARYMVRGLEEGLPLFGLSRSIHVPEGTAFGASGRINIGSNYLWDHILNAPGPNYAPMRDALLNDPHVRAAGRVMFSLQHGLGDLINFSAAGTNTPDDIIDASIAIADELEADTGLVVEWLVSAGPPQQGRSETVYPSDRWWPMRDAYVRLCETDPRFFLGMDFFDLLRNNRTDRHHPFQEMRRFGRRLALSIAERLNRLTNRLVTGAAAGTPGTMPTGWSLTVGGGLTREVVGSGTSSAGRPYVDIRVHGTGSGSAGQLIAFEAANTVPAKSGQAWTASGWLSIVGGSTANLNALRMSVVGSNGSSNVEDTDTAALGTISGAAQRFSAARTLNNAGTTNIRGGVEYTYSAGAVLDFTIRIEGPQLERGSVASALCLPQWMGPEFIAFDELTTTSFRWTLDYGIGQDVYVPPFVEGMALLPAGSSQFATPIPISRFQKQNGPGTTLYVTTHIKTASTGARPAWPWGPAENLQAPSNGISALHPVLNDRVPARTLRRSLLGV